MRIYGFRINLRLTSVIIFGEMADFRPHPICIPRVRQHTLKTAKGVVGPWVGALEQALPGALQIRDGRDCVKQSPFLGDPASHLLPNVLH